MKFNIPKGETPTDKKNRLGQWHLWFAWHPVRVEQGYVVWLETVERIVLWRSYYSGTDIEHFYRAIEDEKE